MTTSDNDRSGGAVRINASDSVFRAIFDAADDAIIILKDGMCVDCNPASVRMFQCEREEIVRSGPGAPAPPHQPDGEPSMQKAARLMQLAQEGEARRFEWVYRRPDRSLFHGDVNMSRVDIGGNPHVLAIIRDITEQRKLEMQLYQSQKMEAVGQLAGGIAHDFNNILTAVIGYASLLVMKMEENNPLRQYAEQIVSSSEKAAGLTKSLLAFGRKQVLSPQRVELKCVLENMGKLLRGLLREDIELSIAFCADPLAVMADTLQLERVFMNLASNARDAMPDGGRITIKTEPFCMDDMFIRAHGYGKPGDYICVSVTDTGVGMDENTRNRVFEPFFTTKEVGKGTGLGLAMAYGIIKQHEGYINLYSEPGQGTTVRVYLPLVSQTPRENEEAEPPVPVGGEETVLLAEDSESIRKSHREILENFGYNVIEAVDGGDAIEKCCRFEERIDVLILDVVMPKKCGREVYDTVREVRPGIKVIFMSGHPADVIAGKGVLDKQPHFIAKPVSPRTLLAKLREVLTE
jgi:two-component system cell cycle sensor histidine kinase/response regulator CckA